MTTNPTDHQAAADIFAHWDEQPRCQVIYDEDETRCGRPASWHWRFHDCSRGIMCDFHHDRWLTVNQPRIELPDKCSRCGKTFTDIADVITFRAL